MTDTSGNHGVPSALTADGARALIEAALRDVVPDASLAGLAPDTDLRDTFELDSLDFVSFVESLGKRAGTCIDDADTEWLRRLDDAIDFIAPRAATTG